MEFQVVMDFFCPKPMKSAELKFELVVVRACKLSRQYIVVPNFGEKLTADFSAVRCSQFSADVSLSNFRP